MEIINADILSKRLHSGLPNEFIKRKVVTERCARQLRTVFANIFCDFEMIVWVHQLILDKGNLSTITSYLNILQALRPKVRIILFIYIYFLSYCLNFLYLSLSGICLEENWVC